MFFVWLQYLLPKRALTGLAGRLATWQAPPPLMQAILKWFVRRYRVNMSEALEQDLSSYSSFNAFFTRPLRPDARPLANADWICPVDGAISQFGAIEGEQIFQAKGHHYTAQALLGGDADLAAQFSDGAFATIYLSPRDYHRIHMPCSGRLLRMIYVPGDLFSVNPQTAVGVPGLFARNERLVCIFEDDGGVAFAMVLVGATIVGSMATVWHGVVNPAKEVRGAGRVLSWDYSQQRVELRQGEEMGRFLVGSTVVMLMPPKLGLRFNPHWMAGQAVRLGQFMAENGQSAQGSTGANAGGVS